MKTMKTLGLLIIGAASLMGLASPASATILTSPTGTQVSAGTAFEAANVGKVVATPPFGNIECSKSTIKGSVSNAGSATTTVGVTLSTLTFSECNATVTVLKTGSLEIHTLGATADGNGTVTGSGQEVTVEFVGTHCIYGTNNTDWGGIDAPSASEPQHNLLTITISFPRIGGRSGAFCGSSAVWHFTATIKDWFLFTYIKVD